MKPAHLYRRVSTLRQSQEGVSLDAQLERLNEYCQRNRFEVVTSHVDEGISGKKFTNRPGLLMAVDAACESGGVLVVYSLSRLTRSIRDLLSIFDRLDKAGADLVSLTENFETHSAMGKFAFKLFGLVAELERELIGERTREALRHKRDNGMKTGGHVPYGFLADADRKLHSVDAEQAVIERMVLMHAKGKSLRSIARALNEQGVPTRSGAEWKAAVVRGIIMRQKESA